MDEPVETWVVEVTADTRALQQELAQAARIGRQFGTSLATAFEGLTLRGKSLGDVLRSLSLTLSHMALRAAFRPLEQGFGSLFSSLLAGGVGFSRGGVVRDSLPVPFASGGVIASPIAFPLSGGRTGLAGERGAEAILPLARGPDGKLGVRARSSPTVTITLNVATADAESFRRSEAQIAAMLSRAVALGQRNL
jgi:phage-related minor tail protein